MKKLFLLDPAVVFLNHGSFGACPSEVFADYQRWQRELERNPVDFLGRRSGALLAEARAVLAQYLGVQARDLIFVPNATTGVNIVARSLGLKPGDEILTTNHEYGACNATWAHVCQHSGARIVPVDIPLPFCADEFASRVLDGVTQRTRVLFLSHITSGTALIFPIADVIQRARYAGILTLIDGAHAPGHIPLNLDALGADFYAGNCHKWLCAPKGSAFLHARAEHHHLLQAPVISWGYGPQDNGHAAYTGSTVLERRLQWQGTRDIAAYLSIPAAISFQQRHNWAQVQQHCHTLAADTLERVCAQTGLAPVSSNADFGQMVVIPVPPVPPRDAQILGKRLLNGHCIEIPVTTHQNRLFVRLSVQGYNTQDDMDALVQALR